MKLLFVSIFLCILFVCVLSQYDHSYGKGHGGGHGFYGYPVGRKWGYSTYIKHPPPKHHGYGGHSHGMHGYGGQGYGGNGFGNQGYGYGGPNFGHNYFPTGPSFGNIPGFRHESYPAQSHTYRHEYIPYDAYDFRKRRDDHVASTPHSGYNSHGQHKNHNYGGSDVYGERSKNYNTGHPKSGFGRLEAIDSIFGKDFPNYLVDLNLPENFQQLIY